MTDENKVREALTRVREKMADAISLYRGFEKTNPSDASHWGGRIWMAEYGLQRLDAELAALSPPGVEKPAEAGDGELTEAAMRVWLEAAASEPCMEPGRRVGGCAGYWITASEIDKAGLLMRAGLRAEQARKALEAERDEARAECEEQARLNGMGASREAKLRSELEQARRDATAECQDNARWRNRAMAAEAESDPAPGSRREGLQGLREWIAETYEKPGCGEVVQTATTSSIPHEVRMRGPLTVRAITLTAPPGLGVECSVTGDGVLTIRVTGGGA